MLQPSFQVLIIYKVTRLIGILKFRCLVHLKGNLNAPSYVLGEVCMQELRGFKV